MGPGVSETLPDVGADFPMFDDEWYVLPLSYEIDTIDIFASGYDGSLMGSINALPNYTKYYGLPEGGSVSTGIVFAIYQVCTLA